MINAEKYADKVNATILNECIADECKECPLGNIECRNRLEVFKWLAQEVDQKEEKEMSKIILDQELIGVLEGLSDFGGFRVENEIVLKGKDVTVTITGNDQITE